MMEHKRARAQSLVEFALLLPFLLLVIFGLIDAALIFQGYLTVAYAAREGARFAIVYQPDQGTCLHRDPSSNDPILEPYPDCPQDYAENPGESDADYFTRRSLLIKRATINAVVGLRTEDICEGADSVACIQAHNGEAGMLGVRIWGFQSFDASESIDMPGLQGLPVRVEVIHNVPLIVFGTFLPDAHIQVRSAAEMINEGIQVGFGNQPPPTFAPLPPPVPPGTAAPTNTPPPPPTFGPTPTSTPIPVYNISLDFESALNQLPDERAHLMTAHVRDEHGANAAGARVTFLTDFGSFIPSGTGVPSVIVSTDGNGLARATLYANRPGISNVTAWLNYDGDGTVDADEPSDTAVKTWQATGPYLIVSDHNPIPNSWIGVSVMDHPPADNPYSLWWCPTWVTSTQVTLRMAYPVNVDGATSDLEDVPVQVPLGVAGQYRIESHRGDGGSNGCAEPATLVAWSGAIEIFDVPPDLAITEVQVISETGVAPGVPVVLQIHVANLAPVAVTDAPSDVDMYADLSVAPSAMQLGVNKQWIGNLGPLEEIVLTMTTTVYDMALHDLWFQVDTTNYVNEGDAGGEFNNVYGPVTIQALTCVPIPGREDSFDGGLGGQWTGLDLPTASHNVQGGQLVINPNRGHIGGTFDGFHYVYQAPVTGDFVMTVRVLSLASTDTGAEAGLVVRTTLDIDSPYFATLVKPNNNVYQDYRSTAGGNAAESGTGTSLPVWLRIERSGNVFKSYFSTNGSTWTQRSNNRTLGFGPVYVGIGASSDNSGVPGPAVFDDFTICTPPGGSCASIAGRSDNFDSGLGGQWLSKTFLVGSESAGGTLSVTPGWGDITGSYDSFRYLYQAPVTGNFSMTVRVMDLLSNDADSNAGLMVRESLNPNAAHYSFFQRKGGNVSREYRSTTGANSSASTVSASPPEYLRIAREGSVFTTYYSSDGENWTLFRTNTMNGLPDSVYIGLATSADVSTPPQPAIYDDFEICTSYNTSNLPTPPTPPVVHPPGLVQCAELLSVPGFEGNPETVFAFWKGGDTNSLVGAYQRTSTQFYRGSFSLRLHASNGFIPCATSHLQPYLYQQVLMPTEIYTFSTIHASGYYFVDMSNLECSQGTVADSADVLSVNLYTTGGAPLLTAQTIRDGGAAAGSWYPVDISLSDGMADPSIYAGQTLRAQWNGYNDTDIDGTFFYLDDLSLQVCTTWPVPPEVAGTASIGGTVKARGQNNIPISLPGADVWAYAQGGAVYHTLSIHDGTYHFYNIPAGVYVIYAETWMNGQLRTSTTTVTVAVNERNYGVNLLLQ